MIELITTIKNMILRSGQIRETGKKIGFVPTMGFLHEGHLSLIKKAAQFTDWCVVSIFVNPTQFGPNEDFEQYPRDLERDRLLVEEAGAHAIFFPEKVALYPKNYLTYIEVENLSDKLCGVSRPTHFRGVATIVCKLFNIVGPHIAYFGRKDAQQAFIIKKMVTDLNMNIEIEILPIVREQDGLAMSSRNIYLSDIERQAATVLYKALQMGFDIYRGGEHDPDKLKTNIRNYINNEPLARIDYIEIVDPTTFDLASSDTDEFLVLLAVHFGRTRLIDNMFYFQEN